jgi:DNA polymerase-3 subunit chi
LGEVYFYHLTRAPLEVTLIRLLERALEQDWRIVLQGRDKGFLSWLDQKLWLGAESGFLPHGLAGGPHDALQPILLTTEPQPADCMISVDGAEISAKHVKTSKRAMILFDGMNEAAVAHARLQWKDLTASECKAKYWSEASGRWEMKAQSG